ncbi:hypothetical protein GM418_31175 [Maribellus comscasis]|uniref:Uncharacterized protein n=1 Tax=Maribellus comscasis TaxID=2681766 RepID=A0A6I6K3C2_9BACT|nr:right-handed parallel beta-helix repeat-containing protein [Maribellus comscasis]QGY47958.1 hypothetical protein GM418_31175 [Maribellus comscasis]
MKFKMASLQNLFAFFCSVFFFFSFSGVVDAQEIYVSPLGNDENEGTKIQPLASLSEAKEKAYKLIENGGFSDVTVFLENGNYQINSPVVFEPLQTTQSSFSIAFQAVTGSSPVISGGVRLSGWTKNAKGFWEAAVPKIEGKKLSPREFFIEGQRAKRSRFPNDGYLRVKQVGEDQRTNFFFEENDFPIPANVEDAELVFLHDWSISRNPILKIDGEENRLTTKDSIGAKDPDFFYIDHWEANPRYFLENAIEFIDENYEWCFVSKENKIIALFPENVNPNQIETVIPVSEGLLVFQGGNDSPVKNIHFNGITFCYSLWNIPEEGYCGVQACNFDPRPDTLGWAVVPAAISARWMENCSLKNCTVENMGGSGIWFGTACKNNVLYNVVVADVSGNGIMIGEGRDREVGSGKWWETAPEQVALNNTIENCLVTQSGAQYFGAVGIWCGLTAETKIKDNKIFDLPYSGISIGWMWSPQPTPCRDNVIDGNHIHHIMKILSDGGGIYMLGLQPGSKIINNHIHDVTVNAGRAESNGMFLDEGTTNVVVANNLIYNIAKSPLRFHRATTNLVKDNYLFCENENPPIRYNRTNEEDIEKVNNKVFSEENNNYEAELKKAIQLRK